MINGLNADNLKMTSRKNVVMNIQTGMFYGSSFNGSYFWTYDLNSTMLFDRSISNKQLIKYAKEDLKVKEEDLCVKTIEFIGFFTED